MYNTCTRTFIYDGVYCSTNRTLCLTNCISHINMVIAILFSQTASTLKYYNTHVLVKFFIVKSQTQPPLALCRARRTLTLRVLSPPELPHGGKFLQAQIGELSDYRVLLIQRVLSPPELPHGGGIVVLFVTSQNHLHLPPPRLQHNFAYSYVPWVGKHLTLQHIVRAYLQVACIVSDLPLGTGRQ